MVDEPTSMAINAKVSYTSTFELSDADYGRSLEEDLVTIFNSTGPMYSKPPVPWYERWLAAVRPQDPMTWVMTGYGLVHVGLGILFPFLGRLDLIMLIPLGMLVMWMSYFMDRYT